MLPVEPLTLLAFIPAGLALNLTPGADSGRGLVSSANGRQTWKSLCDSVRGEIVRRGTRRA